MSKVLCHANRIEEGALPTDAVICFDCCLSRETIKVAPGFCLEAGTMMLKDAVSGLWSPLTSVNIPTTLAATDRVGVLFCPRVNTLDNKPGDCVVVSYHAKVKSNCIQWFVPTTTPATAPLTPVQKKAVLDHLLNVQKVQAIVAV